MISWCLLISYAENCQNRRKNYCRDRRSENHVIAGIAVIGEENLFAADLRRRAQNLKKKWSASALACGNLVESRLA